MQPCPWPTVANCTYTAGGSCEVEDGFEEAFNGNWVGDAEDEVWTVCKDVHIVVNVTRPDGIPSIDGMFLRLLPGHSVWGDVKITVRPEPVLGYPEDAVLSNHVLAASQTDIGGLQWEGVKESEFWRIEIVVTGSPIQPSSLFGACPTIVEIGFNGTCQVIQTLLCCCCGCSACVVRVS